MSKVDEAELTWWRSLPPMEVTAHGFCSLPEYSASSPTGVIPGKTWKRHNGSYDQRFIQAGGTPLWIICQYQEAPPQMRRVYNGEKRIYEDKMVEMCKTVMFRPVIKVKAKRRVVDCWDRPLVSV